MYYLKHRKNIFCNFTIFELVNRIGDFESLYIVNVKSTRRFRPIFVAFFKNINLIVCRLIQFAESYSMSQVTLNIPSTTNTQLWMLYFCSFCTYIQSILKILAECAVALDRVCNLFWSDICNDKRIKEFSHPRHQQPSLIFRSNC